MLIRLNKEQEFSTIPDDFLSRFYYTKAMRSLPHDLSTALADFEKAA